MAETTLRAPAPNRVGELPHAYPEALEEISECQVCGAEVAYDGEDDYDAGIWTHTETLGYFCEAAG